MIVVDNGMYGTIRMHQERALSRPGQRDATEESGFRRLRARLRRPWRDGEATAEFAPAFERALASGKPAILHVKIDPEAITPMTTLAAIRKKALAEQAKA